MITIEDASKRAANRMSVMECLYEWDIKGTTFEINDGKVVFAKDAEN